MLSERLSAWMERRFHEFPSTDSQAVLTGSFSYRTALTYAVGGTIVDLGGGFSPLNGFLAESGMKVFVVDLLEEYFSHSTVTSPVTPLIEKLKQSGVEFISADLVEFDLRNRFAANSVDCVASYHTLEHLHHSPKRLLESAIAVLKPGGTLVIEVPNAVNLAKRIRVALGRTNYLPYRQFYEHDKWVGHVREYTLGDLRALASFLPLSSSRIEGRNWYGSLYRTKLLASVIPLVDATLRLRPGLCGSLYLIGRK